MSLGLKFDGGRGDAWDQLFAGKSAEIANAAHLALKAAGDEILDKGRASIAAAGFSSAWQNALKVTVNLPKGIGGAVSVRHSIRYAMVFEQGMTIHGEPLLWLPLPSCPQTIGGHHPTPRRYQQSIGPLRYVRGRGHPLLVGKSSVPPKEPPAPGVNRLSGPRREKVASLRSGAANGGYDVPMFFGVSSVTIPKKFDVLGVVERAYANLAATFESSLTEV